MYSNYIENKTILIVEDDLFSYKLLIEYLSDNSVQILYAKNGIEAIKICKQNPDIDLVLMDIKMPKKDGIEASKEIRKFRKKLPIIAQTANAMTHETEVFRQTGINDFLTKPFKKEDFIKKISQYISKNIQVII